MIKSSKSLNKKIFFVFDFDQTIINLNSDSEILPLLSENSKKYLEPLYENSTNWANYMQEVYKRMKQDKIKIEQIKEIVENLPLNKGYDELFDLIRNNKDKIDALIISGANTLFLKWFIEKKGYHDIFPNYYSNWAREDEDLVIKIESHHVHNCESCDKSQCKKKILMEHIHQIEGSDHKNNNYFYDTLIYAGDGENDYCPGTILRENDLFFPRKGYALDRKLKKGFANNLKCKIHIWEDAYKIIDELKKLL